MTGMRTKIAAAVTAAVLLAAPAGAQQLPGGLGGALGALTGGGGGAAMPSVGSASMGNVAGLLQYCVTNNLLGGGNAGGVQQSLLGKLGGPGQAAGNSDYTAGTNGMLQTGNGQGFNLGGDMMAQLKQQVCSMIMQRAQSFL